MPQGIVIIEWDEFQGGQVKLKHPEDLEVPDNFVQILQISHNFNPGIMTIKEQGVHALSLGNQELQKVIVLMLTKYEDAEDFKEILQTINDSIVGIDDDEMLANELKRLFGAAQTVFRAREAVMVKLANEIAELKNVQVDTRNAIEWLLKHERSLRKQIIFEILLNGPQNMKNLSGTFKVEEAKLRLELTKMEKAKIVELKDRLYSLLIQYQV